MHNVQQYEKSLIKESKSSTIRDSVLNKFLAHKTTKINQIKVIDSKNQRIQEVSSKFLESWHVTQTANEQQEVMSGI